METYRLHWHQKGTGELEDCRSIPACASPPSPSNCASCHEVGPICRECRVPKSGLKMQELKITETLQFFLSSPTNTQIKPILKQQLRLSRLTVILDIFTADMDISLDFE
jgi:hypothetical protein